jgi:hypothetical protein
MEYVIISKNECHSEEIPYDIVKAMAQLAKDKCG